MQIVLAADHGGYEFKQQIKEWLKTKKGIKIIDVGALEYKALDGFTDYSAEAVKQIRANKDTIGIFVCGTGTLAAIAANRYKGIRAAMCHRVEYAVQAREHNDANVLALGGRYLQLEEAQKIVDAFLNTKFLGGKYKPRVDMLDK